MGDQRYDGVVATDAEQARLSRERERAHWRTAHPESAPLPRAAGEDGLDLSVVVTAHNVGPWIGELLESLQAQTIHGGETGPPGIVEYLIVDDHSSDETSSVISAVVGDDPRFIVLTPDGVGGAHARNFGADFARGRYLAFCDGDDIVPEHGYAVLMAAAGGQDIVFGNYLKFTPAKAWVPSRQWDGYLESRSGVKVADHPTLLNHRAPWNKVFRTDFWRRHDIVFPEVPRSNDIVPMTLAYTRAERVAVVPEIVYLYRGRPGATSMTSKATSLASNRSYLRQENAVADLVAPFPSLARQHRWLFGVRDGRAHLLRYLHAIVDQPVDAEIVAAFRRLWSRIDEDFLEELTEEHLAVFQTMLGATPDRAPEVLRALDTTMTRENPVGWAAATKALLADPSPVNGWLKPPAFVDRYVVPQLRELLRDHDDPVALAPLIAPILDAADRVTDGAPSMAMRRLDVTLHGALTELRSGHPTNFAQRVRQASEVKMSVERVQRVAGGLRLSGRFTGPDGFVPEQLLRIGGTTFRAVAPVAVDGRGGWSAVLGHTGLDETKRRLAVSASYNDESHVFYLRHQLTGGRAGGRTRAWGLHGVATIVADPARRGSVTATWRMWKLEQRLRRGLRRLISK